MSSKLKIAIASLLMLGAASAAMAQDADPNLMNRYPQYNGVVADAALQQAPAALHKAGKVTSANQENWVAVDSTDRASSPFASN